MSDSLFASIRIPSTLIAVVLIGGASQAHAQTWQGPYVGGTIGAILQNGDDDERIEFDTNLDDEFEDTVRTITGAEAFTSACSGLATSPTSNNDCDDDEDGLVLGLRGGYDWATAGGLVVGVVADVTFPDVTDSVSTFSTTPAFYGMTRELNAVTALRGRVGGGTDRWLAYGTGGLAFGWVDHRFITSNTVNTFDRVNSDDGDEDGSRDGSWGYQLGAGLEYRIGPRLSLTGEYLFTALDDRDDAVIRATGPAPAGNPFLLVNQSGTELRRSDWFAMHALTVGVQWRF